MKLINILSKLQRLDQPVLETVDVATIVGVEKAHASKIATRLAGAGHLLALRRGVWAFPGRLDPLAMPERLTAPQPAYVSLQSALYHHGMISQIPASIYAVSLARTRRYTTPLAVVSIHHVAPDFFFGYETLGENGIQMARPEKALLDVFYLTPARSRLFCQLPEVEKSDKFNIADAQHMIARIPFLSRRTMVATRFKQWLADLPHQRPKTTISVQSSGNVTDTAAP
jgi:predicted transcriptional regulator of viral defense system